MTFNDLAIYYDTHADFFQLEIIPAGAQSFIADFPDNRDWRWALHDDKVDCKPLLRSLEQVNTPIMVTGYIPVSVKQELSHEQMAVPFNPQKELLALGALRYSKKILPSCIEAMRSGDTSSKEYKTAKLLMSWSFWLGDKKYFETGEIKKL